MQEIFSIDENDRGEAAIALGISLHALMIGEQRCSRNDALGWARERPRAFLVSSQT